MATPSPSISTDTQSLFVSGDVVIANPKEAAALFSVVVILSVLLENVFGAFRENRSRYVKLLFLQISEEIMIVGVIGLIFVFTVQSVDNMPARWVLLFRWIQMVLFIMMVLFIGAIVYFALSVRKIIGKWQTLETTITELSSITDPVFSSLSFFQESYAVIRLVFREQLANLDRTAASQAKKKNATRAQKAMHAAMLHGGHNVTLADYLQLMAQNVVVKFTDITWQGWLSLIFLTGSNSIRLFLLPGQLQSKDSADYTTDDRMLNVMTYIFLIGWLPMVAFLIGFGLQIHSFNSFLHKARHRMMTQQLELDDDAKGNAVEMEEQPKERKKPKTKMGSSTVWLPPKQLTAQLLGEAYEDPSVYLLRGNKAFTLHIFKIPVLMTLLFMGMFVVGIWGEVSTTFGTKQIYVLPLAFIPPVVVLVLIPISLIVVTILTSLGTRLDEDVVRKLAKGSGVENLQRTGQLDESDDESDTELAAADSLARESKSKDGSGISVADLERLEMRLLAARDRTGSTFTNGSDPSSNSHEIAALKARIKFLEDLCISYGIPIAGSAGNEASADGAPPQTLAGVCAAMAQLQETSARLAEQQTQILAMQHRVSGQATIIGASGQALPTNSGQHMAHVQSADGNISLARSSSAHQLEAIAAARKITPNGKQKGFNVRSVSDRGSGAFVNRQSQDISRAVGGSSLL